MPLDHAAGAFGQILLLDLMPICYQKQLTFTDITLELNGTNVKKSIVTIVIGPTPYLSRVLKSMSKSELCKQ
jgi:hypothetical protein